MSTPQNKAKTIRKLQQLIDDINPIIDNHLQRMTVKELDFLLSDCKDYLKINLQDSIQETYNTKKANNTGDITASPLDEILNSYLDK